MTDDEKSQRPRHTHKWNLQSDEDFAEEGIRLLGYMIAAQHNIPCVHQDHPAVQAVESMVGGMMRGHQILPGLAESVEVFAHIFFAAGQQYAIDGYASSAHPGFEPETDISDDGETMEAWAKEHLEYTKKWRRDIRERFYGPRKKRGLAEILAHLVEEHGEALEVDVNLSEGEVLQKLLGRQRTAQEKPSDDRAAGPYL